MTYLNIAGALACIGLAILVASRRRRHGLPYPPGPVQKWLIGNLLDMPTSSSWLRFSQWGAKYGEITYVSVLGEPIIILNTFEACKKLLDRRGATASGRPDSIMLELMSSHKGITPSQETPRWRYQRKLTHIAFGSQVASQYHHIQESHTTMFLKKMLDSQANCETELRLAIGRIIFAITYGLSTEVHLEEYIRMSDELLSSFLEALIPGRFLVELLPILRFVPSWVPGAGFKRYANHIYDVSECHAAVYYELVRKELAAGSAPPSFVANCLESQAAGDITSSLGSQEAEEEALKWAAATMYLAGIHTTNQTICKFLTAMQLYPEVQRKAQEEIARVIGSERLPSIADRQHLPYVNAVIAETLRWHPGVATGIPHRMTTDDVYKGYFIPKNATIIFNAWNMSLHAEDGSPLNDPEVFLPERFLPKASLRPLDPAEYVFGFGRRVCPGRWVAEDMIFIMITNLLATFSVSPPVDENGKEVQLEITWTGSDAVSYPQPLRPRFTPRSPAAVELIKKATLSTL